MAIDLRQSTASQEIPLGYFVDSTDGNTEKTGLTIANTDIKIWKTGLAFFCKLLLSKNRASRRELLDANADRISRSDFFLYFFTGRKYHQRAGVLLDSA